jgi:hypothetical protein
MGAAQKEVGSPEMGAAQKEAGSPEMGAAQEVGVPGDGGARPGGEESVEVPLLAAAANPSRCCSLRCGGLLLSIGVRRIGGRRRA